MKIEIMQQETIRTKKEVKILKHATIPSFAGSSVCSICEESIDDETQIVFIVPYHSEYAHIKCFEEATRMRFTSSLS